MGNLIAYSGISTKIKAMERWRIHESQFEAMSQLQTVSEAVQFLKQFPPYAALFSGAEEGEIHRGDIEQRLNQSQYRDFAKLYRFASAAQRKFLDLYFLHYELDAIKTCLRNAAGHREQRQDLSVFQEFFERHSKVDLIKLSESQDIGQLIENLKGSPYYCALRTLEQNGAVTLPACETALDMMYFKAIWKRAGDMASKSEQEIIKQCFGTKMDMLNLQWICRSKKYYRLSPGTIYAMIIPINYHLTKQEINGMVQAENLEQVYDLIRTSWYGRLEEASGEARLDLEKLAWEINNRIYEMSCRKNPYSIASINSYLYFKEQEIKRIINTIEKIRYGVYGSK